MRLFGYRGIDLINPIKWKRAYDAKVVSKYKHLFPSLQIHIAEQVMWRRLNCPECVSLGKCPECGCPIDEKMSTPEESCTKGLWGEFLEESEWETYKETYQIKFKLISKFHKDE